MASRITPISGFPEFNPAQQIGVERILRLIRETYESFGYTPVETSAVERLADLQKKGLDGKEIYVLRRMQARPDDPDSALALHFDLTVPLARFVAQHYATLTFPFKRYQIQPVWRGERPKDGRYRQFHQCDIDVIGDGHLPLDYDAEIPAVIFRLFSQMNIGDFSIRINNRKILMGLFSSWGLERPEAVRFAMKIVDDIEKMPVDKTVEGLTKAGISKSDIERLLFVFRESFESNDRTLATLRAMHVNSMFEEGVEELEYVVARSPLHVPNKNDLALDGVSVSEIGRQFSRTHHDPRLDYERALQIDLSIARGLDYYTGTVYETRLNQHPEIGSICSGGRYEELISTFIDRTLPGVGISIGLTRLLRRLYDAKLLKAERSTPARVFIAMMDKDTLPTLLSLSYRIRAAGIACETYLGEQSLRWQLGYASRKGFEMVILADSKEIERNVVQVKHLGTAQQQEITLGQVIPFIRMQLE